MPWTGRPLDWSLAPLAALRRWPADWPAVMLHSGRFDAVWSRYSILARPTGAYRFVDAPAPGAGQWLGPTPHDLPALSNKPMADLRALRRWDPASLWVGYLGYDVSRYLETLPSDAARDRDWPIVQMQRCPGWLVHDAAEGRWYAAGDWQHDPPPLPSLPETERTFEAGAVHSPQSLDSYIKQVQRVKDHIAAGDVFQVNLAHRFTASFTGEPRALFEALAGTSPAWYGAHVELLGQADEPRRALCSTSPELFLSLDEQGQVLTRPIKGTRPASADPAALRDSEKDAAELNMIIDLLRNDLGRVCDYGSVRVTQPRTIETHPTVHHGVATVAGQLHPSKDLVHLLKATMPGGSVTGAPKVQAMDVIDRLEPVRRGPYCGAIGWVCGGAAQWNIAIRTLLAETDPTQRGAGRVDFSVGGGIVADSDPASEYHETLDKAQAMTRALASPIKSRRTAPT
jgi:para-aminobenzoate synthetase component 1